MFNIGPSQNSGMMDSIRKKMGGNTGIAGGMGRPRLQPGGGYGPSSRPQVMPRRPMGSSSGNTPFGMGPMPQMGRQPVSSTMPVGRPRPNIIPAPSGMPPGMGDGMVQQPGQQPIEENQLWRTYNRLLGGPMAPRMLL